MEVARPRNKQVQLEVILLHPDDGVVVLTRIVIQSDPRPEVDVSRLGRGPHVEDAAVVGEPPPELRSNIVLAVTSILSFA